MEIARRTTRGEKGKRTVNNGGEPLNFRTDAKRGDYGKYVGIVNVFGHLAERADVGRTRVRR